MVLFFVFIRIIVIILLVALVVYFIYRYNKAKKLDDFFMSEIMDRTNFGSLEDEYNRLISIYNDPAKRAFVLKHGIAGINSIVNDKFEIQETSGKIGGTSFVFVKPDNEKKDTNQTSLKANVHDNK